MTRGFSKVIITGNLTRDPELRTTPNGATVCSFTVAVNRTYKDSSGTNQESVSFIDCSAWSKPGEIINQYAKKGTGILVSGRLEQRSWEDKTTGQKRSRVEIIVEEFNFLGGADANGAGSYAAGASYGAAPAADTASAAPADGAPADGAEVIPQDVPADGKVDLKDVPF